MGNTVAKRAPESGADCLSDYSDSEPRFHMYKDSVAKVRFAKKGVAAAEKDGGCPETTIPKALKKAVEQYGDRAALRVELPYPPFENGKAAPSAPLSSWKTWTYKEYYNDCRKAAKGFMALNLARYDGVSILGFNSPEWFMAFNSCIMAGGKVTGIYPTDTAPQIQYKALLADCSIAVCEEKSGYDRYASIVEELPYLKAIVCWDYKDGKDITRADGSVVKFLTWESLIELGEKEGDDQKLDEVMDSLESGHCACLVFTSGTTGHPKAVMISHDSLIYQSYAVLVKGCPPNYGVGNGEERCLSYLPLSHVAGMMVDIVCPLVCTAFRKASVSSNFARPYDLKVGTLGDRIRAVKPTIFFGVPRVFEKIADKIKAVGAQNTGIKKTLANWAKAQALQHGKDHLLGGSGGSSFQFKLASKLLAKIRVAIGLDECKFIFSSAAPLARETMEYFASLNININEVYGMSECSGATTWSTDDHHLWESIGYQMEGTEVRVFDVKPDGTKVPAEAANNILDTEEKFKGELCFRGRHIMMGYLCNPKLGQEHIDEITKKNQETIDSEGFLHSGDMAVVDKAGMFKICGRYKELIITAGGENIAPVPIENALKKNCPAIANAMMIGDKRKFNICLITLKAVGASGQAPGGEELEGPAKALVSGVNTIPEACASADYIKLITDAITRTNNDGDVCPSNASRIQKFSILPRDFSIETEELTASLKLKRNVVTTKYAELIDAVYESNDTYVPCPGVSKVVEN